MEELIQNELKQRIAILKKEANELIGKGFANLSDDEQNRFQDLVTKQMDLIVELYSKKKNSGL